MSKSQVENKSVSLKIEAQVKQGKLLGTFRRTICNAVYASFLNIPYAAPPIGDLRFKDPQPPACWEGIRDANQNENVCCAQMTRYPKYDYIGSEDCLYLNIYVPFWRKKTREIAVMVWIHGGYFSSGSGNFTDVRPDYLLEKDVILVTVNYRLGAFGFLNLNHVVASGNQGLKDQVFALQWIKENIAGFGGDPNNVTVFGSNVGAVCVHLLMLSPSSTDLFHKAILQGGVATMNWAIKHHDTVNNSYRLAIKLGSKSSNPEDIVEFLNKIPAIYIVYAQSFMLHPQEPNIRRVIFGPSIDIYAENPFLACSPCELLHNGNHKPIMLGHTTSEYLKFLDECTQERFKKLYRTLPIHVRTLLPQDASRQQVSQLARRCRKFYFGCRSPKSFRLADVLQCYSEIYFDIPITMIADGRRKLAEAPTYVYEFSHVGNQKITDKNLYSYNVHPPVSSQGDDLVYLFFTPIHKAGNISPPDPETDDFKVIEIMTSMWVNFANTGDPLPENKHIPENKHMPVKWMPATKKDFWYLDISQELLLDELSTTIAYYNALLGK